MKKKEQSFEIEQSIKNFKYINKLRKKLSLRSILVSLGLIIAIALPSLSTLVFGLFNVGFISLSTILVFFLTNYLQFNLRNLTYLKEAKSIYQGLIPLIEEKKVNSDVLDYLMDNSLERYNEILDFKDRHKLNSLRKLEKLESKQKDFEIDDKKYKSMIVIRHRVAEDLLFKVFNSTHLGIPEGRLYFSKWWIGRLHEKHISTL
ncbi:hypothetical protein [Bacillus sp. FSL M8-0168]|uniref:hypothetical protein n=1 Tax=Bacillus sp. FSL M8-0168 TaxID=2921614 RepID=UPI0030FDD41F